MFGMTAATTSTFSLSETVNASIDASGDVDPSIIAAKVIATLTPTEIEEALHTTLRPYVAVILGNRRRSHPTPQNQSPRVVKARQANWQRICGDSLRTASGYKRFGDCTVDDLYFAAAERRDQAAAFAAMASKFDRCAAVLAASSAPIIEKLTRVEQDQIEAILA